MKFLLYLGHIVACAILVKFTSVYKQDFFALNNQITYLGVLLGFSLTLYTFGISSLKDVYDNIESMVFKDARRKSRVLNLLEGVFNEIEGDIKIVFYGIIFVFANAIAKDTLNPFNWDVEKYKIPEFVSILIFTLSTHAMYDIMKSLFSLSSLVFKKEKKK